MGVEHRKNFEISNVVAQVISRCPFCQLTFRASKITVVSVHHETHVLHVTCDCCESSIILSLLINDIGVSSVGVITDLSEEEARRFQDIRQLSTDDVLAVYQAVHMGWFIETIASR